MKRKFLHFGFKRAVLSIAVVFSSWAVSAQTNVYDDIIATSPNHTYLKAAIDQEGLDVALQNNMATLTVFAPDNIAFDNLAAALGTDIMGLLALPNLSDILLYHVLGVTAPSSAINNGDIVTPLNTVNTIKLTKTSMGAVYANQSMVALADLNADNGVVHSMSAVLLPNETVVDIALDNGFSSLATAVVTAELLPALTDPLAELTVFAPDNIAFDNLAAALGTDIMGLLALPNLSDILLYHVLGVTAPSSAINNGDIVTPLNAANTIKLTKTSTGDVYANHSMVAIADLNADNGVVHAMNAILLPNETVVDIALDNGFSTLATAVVTAELLPALTDPFAELTVFAPDNAAFDDLAVALGTDIMGLLANPQLSDILLYHVVDGIVMSTDLTNGAVPTLNGQSVIVDLSSGVMINSSNVILADVTADNGVVHAIDAVLVPSLAGLEDAGSMDMYVSPNPAVNELKISGSMNGEYDVFNVCGTSVISGATDQGKLNISDLSSGHYLIRLTNSQGSFNTQFVKQ